MQITANKAKLTLIFCTTEIHILIFSYNENINIKYITFRSVLYSTLCIQFVR